MQAHDSPPVHTSRKNTDSFTASGYSMHRYSHGHAYAANSGACNSATTLPRLTLTEYCNGLLHYLYSDPDSIGASDDAATQNRNAFSTSLWARISYSCYRSVVCTCFSTIHEDWCLNRCWEDDCCRIILGSVRNFRCQSTLAKVSLDTGEEKTDVRWKWYHFVRQSPDAFISQSRFPKKKHNGVDHATGKRNQ